MRSVRQRLYSPSAPRRVAQAATELLVLSAAAGGLFAALVIR